MLKLLERNIAAIDERLVLLAPNHDIPDSFLNVTLDNTRHAGMVADMQRMRGAVYAEDGAIARGQLSHDGRHQTAEDDRSWHLLMLDQHGRPTACAWYLQHETTSSFDQLRVRGCPLAFADNWRHILWGAVESELAMAREAGLHYAEVGGWAVARQSRCTSEGLLLALAAYSLGRIMGGALGLTTATVRHSSSNILRRLGGSHLRAGGESVPPYYDAKYNCTMELLKFDSRHPNPKYAGMIELLRQRLGSVAVMARRVPVVQPSVLKGFLLPEYAPSPAAA